MSTTELLDKVPSGGQVDELEATFAEVNDEPDWLKRLARLAAIHRDMVEVADPTEANRLSFMSRLRRYWPRHLLEGKPDVQLRNYYELTCDPQFPTSFLRLFWPDFLTRLANLIRPGSGLRYRTKAKMVQVTEEWLESATEVPRWIHKVPQRGLYSVIRELQKDKRGIETDRSNVPLLARGAVSYGFSACEIILRQLFSFYGRFLYGVTDGSYRAKVLEQYDAEAEQRSQEEWARKLPELGQVYESLEGASPAEHEAALKQFVGYVLSEKWPRGYSMMPPARGLRKWEERGPDFGFVAWIELLKQLDRWIESETVCDLKEFEAMFGRRRLFFDEADRRGEPLRIIKMHDDLTIDYVNIKRSREPRAIQELKKLNELRKYYAHGKLPDSLLPSHSQNLCNGALKILSALIDLLERLKGRVFPEVVVPRRFIQVEPDWVRMDYIGEDNPKQLRHIRFPLSALSHLQGITSSLLGREVYLFHQDAPDDWLTRALYILPVDED